MSPVAIDRHEPIGSSTAAETIDRLRHQALDGPCQAFRSRSGKRIREAILRAGYRIAGGEGDPPPCLADAVECLHAGSLVIDDIQDQSPTRRGGPAMHVAIGTPRAINAGNWMYFVALETLSECDLSPDRSQRMLRAMIKTARRCHEGQAIDLSATVTELPPDLWRPVTRRISGLKTGSLVALSMSIGATAAGASRSLTRTVRRFGSRVGIALQMRNDLEELRQSIDPPSGAGRRQDDLRHARVTWPWAWAATIDPAAAQAGADQLRRAIAVDDRRCLIEIAEALVDRVGRAADRSIKRGIERELRLLGEHVTDRRLLREFEASLAVITKSPSSRAPAQPLTDNPASSP